MIDLRQLKRSFSYAAKGIRQVAKEEQNFRVQLTVAVIVIALMFAFRLSEVEMALITLAIVLVLVLELVNSIFERMVDLMKPRVHDYVKDIKDIMAGTVLVASIGALLIGALIFWPHAAAWLFR